MARVQQASKTDLAASNFFMQLSERLKRYRDLVARCHPDKTDRTKLGAFSKEFRQHNNALFSLREKLRATIPNNRKYRIIHDDRAFLGHSVLTNIAPVMELPKYIERGNADALQVYEYGLHTLSASRALTSALGKFFANRKESNAVNLPKLFGELREGFGAIYEPKIIFSGANLRTRGDKDLLYKLFFDIFHNSEKAGSTKIRVSLKTSGPKVKIIVADDGVGVSQKMKSSLFAGKSGFFEQTQRSGAGTGLETGKRIVEMHGGTIRHVGPNKQGKGAVFEIVLPRAC